MITGPPLLILLPLAFASVILLLRRWTPLAALLASATALAMAGLCLGLPLNRPISVLGWQVALGQPMMVLGREFALGIANSLALGFLWLIAAVAFLFAWRIPQGNLFFALGLVILSLLGAAMMIRHFVFAVLFLWVANLVIVFIVQGEQQGLRRGALRYLVMVSLAVPPLLTALWLIDLHAVNPDNPALLRQAVVLLGIGFAILLAVVPFHSWVSALATDAPPIVTAFILTAINTVVILLMLNLLQSYSWLSEDPQVFRLLRLGGASMAVVGGGLALLQRNFSRLMGYAVLSDMGCTLMALGVISSAGLTAAVLQVVHRSVGLLLAAMGLAAVRHQVGSDAFDGLSRVGRRLPIAVAGLVLGGLSLGGMPLTAGFPSRWAIYRLLPEQELGLAMLLSGGAVTLAYLRGLVALLGFSTQGQVKRESIVASLIIVGMIVLCLGLGIFPQWLLSAVQRVAGSFSFLK